MAQCLTTHKSIRSILELCNRIGSSTVSVMWYQMGPRPRNHHTFSNRSQIHRDDLFDVYGIVAFWQHFLPGSWVKIDPGLVNRDWICMILAR